MRDSGLPGRADGRVFGRVDADRGRSRRSLWRVAQSDCERHAGARAADRARAREAVMSPGIVMAMACALSGLLMYAHAVWVA